MFKALPFPEETFTVQSIYLQCIPHLAIWDTFVHYSNGTRQAWYTSQKSQPSKLTHSIMSCAPDRHPISYSSSSLWRAANRPQPWNGHMSHCTSSCTSLLVSNLFPISFSTHKALQNNKEVAVSVHLPAIITSPSCSPIVCSEAFLE